MHTLNVYRYSILAILLVLVQPQLYGQDTLTLGNEQSLLLEQMYDEDHQVFDLRLGENPERFKAYYRDLVIVNPYDRDTTIDIHLRVMKAEVMVFHDNKLIRTERIGEYQSFTAYESYPFYAPVDLRANDHATVRIKKENYFVYPSREFSIKIVSLDEKSNEKTRMLFSNKYAYTFSLLFQGAILFMMIYILLMYFQNRSRMYLYYALYMFGVAFYYYMRIDKFFGFNIILPSFPESYVLLNQPIQLFFFVFYSLFVLDFLDLKDHDKLLATLIKSAVYIYIVGAVVIIFYIILTGDALTVQQLMPYTFGAITLFSIFAIVRLLLTGPKGITRYIVTGTALLTVFSLIALLLSFGIIGNDGLLFNLNIFPINYSQFGALLEILCFSLGLGYKMRKDHQARKEAQEQMIEYYKENKRLTEELNRDLEEKVQERTQTIEQQTIELEEEKANRIREEYDKKLAVMEMAALKAQMNPHFVFNALNSMKQLVMSGQEDDAISYLSKFSKLMRNILNNSAESKTSLADELETCRLYMEIESKRFADNFYFDIQVDSDVDTSFVSLPSMLLQPYVENAIWHGLLHKEGYRELKIRVSKSLGEVIVRIIDNGIGREASMRIRSKQSTKSKSYGMKISSDRINLYNQLYGSQIRQYINDKVGVDSSALGTEVVLHIPIDD